MKITINAQHGTRLAMPIFSGAYGPRVRTAAFDGGFVSVEGTRSGSGWSPPV